jgi:hypothetical protein
MLNLLHIIEEQTTKQIKKIVVPKKIKMAPKFKMANKTKFACKNYKSSCSAGGLSTRLC